jgi:hypothetical protein
VTSQIRYTNPDGSSFTRAYRPIALTSDDPLARLKEFLRLTDGMVLDPLYGLMRRRDVASIARRNMIREDEVFAAKLALLGPWSHVPEVLAHRHLATAPLSALTGRLDVPAWQHTRPRPFNAVSSCV